jgi:hypothetical protein
LSDSAHGAERFPPGFHGRQSGGGLFLYEFFEMELKLVLQFGLDSSPPEKRPDAQVEPVERSHVIPPGTPD